MHCVHSETNVTKLFIYSFILQDSESSEVLYVMVWQLNFPMFELFVCKTCLYIKDFLVVIKAQPLGPPKPPYLGSSTLFVCLLICCYFASLGASGLRFGKCSFTSLGPRNECLNMLSICVHAFLNFLF